MRILGFILRKEFTQIFRDKRMLVIILMIPLMQMLILVYAANFDIKKINMAVVDHDMSSVSKRLISTFEGSPFFEIKYVAENDNDAETAMSHDAVSMSLIIPAKFEKQLMREGNATLQLQFSAIDGSASQVGYGYAQSIVSKFNTNITCEIMGLAELKPVASINIQPKYWFNNQLDYKWYMAPGILVVLVTIIGMFLSGMNLVKEKEIGTIEQLNVTPIKKYQLIAGKLIPFWVIGLADLAFGLIVARVAFNLPFEGSLPTLFGFAAIYLIGILAGGLLISTFANTQQQVLFIGFFFVMLFVLMGGIFTSVESMPYWAQVLDRFNPICYFMSVVRMILLKGSSINDIIPQIEFVVAFGLILLPFAIIKYRKRA